MRVLPGCRAAGRVLVSVWVYRSNWWRDHRQHFRNAAGRHAPAWEAADASCGRRCFFFQAEDGIRDIGV